MQMQHLTHKSVSLALHSLEFLHKSSVFLYQTERRCRIEEGRVASFQPCVCSVTWAWRPPRPLTVRQDRGRMLTLLIAALEDSVPLRWNISPLLGHDLTSLRQRLNGFSSRVGQEERRKKETWRKWGRWSESFKDIKRKRKKKDFKNNVSKLFEENRPKYSWCYVIMSTFQNKWL